MKTDLIIIGAGGHAKVLIDCLEQQPDVTILGILDNNQNMHDKLVLGVRILGGDDKITDYDPAKVQLVNALGSVDIPLRRKALFSQFKSVGFRFYSVIHASAIIAPSVQLGEGVQVMAGAILQPDCKIGANVIINTSIMMLLSKITCILPLVLSYPVMSILKQTPTLVCARLFCKACKSANAV
jgi:sugar O-acyltransferase (sialic acid O-acetyltransferase NeuD family)